MELSLSTYNLKNVLIIDNHEIPKISEKTKNLDVCKNTCNNMLSDQPVDSLKTRITEFKELTEKLTKAEENPKKWVILASLLAVIATAMTVTFIALAVLFIPSASIGLALFGAFCPSLALYSLVGTVASTIWAYCENTKIPKTRKQLEESQNALLTALQKHEECAKTLKNEINKEIEKLQNTGSVSLQTYQTALNEIAEVEKFMQNLKTTN